MTAVVVSLGGAGRVACAGCGIGLHLAAWRFTGPGRPRPGLWCGRCALPIVQAEADEPIGVEVPGQLDLLDEVDGEVDQ